ncbi:MAG: hypothetical protein AMS15_09470 [Planctomycetes bacterium DG_23]|nr:MAG: hypothetical protein AMS15_09470 [Planctomycetes bacterium DG_23]
MPIYGEYHFETGDFSEWDGTEASGTGNSIAVSSVRAKAGTYSAKVHIESSGKARCYDYNIMDLGAGSNIWASGWFFFPTGFDVDSGIHWAILYPQQTGSPYQSIRVHINDAEELRVYNALNAAWHDQASPIAVPLNEWVGIELYIYAHDTNGQIELWQNGGRIIEVSGIDTMPSTNWSNLYAGCGYMGGTPSSTYEFWFDEIYLQDEQKITPAVVQAIRLNPLGLRRFGGF